LFCILCNKKYTNTKNKWCKPCQISYLKENFANWTSGNEKIDNFIQEMQLKIKDYYDIVIEWIPYNKFDIVEELGEYDSFTSIYLVKWKDGPLEYDKSVKKYTRNPNKIIPFKCLYNIQNVDDIINRV
jgi:hypothetical protein